MKIIPLERYDRKNVMWIFIFLFRFCPPISYVCQTKRSYKGNDILTNYIYQSESTNEQSQTQEHQLLSSTLHFLLWNPSVEPSYFQVLSSIPLGAEPM